MSFQSSLNFLLPLKGEDNSRLGADIDAQGLSECLSTIDTLHFLSLAVLPVATSATSTQCLLLEANIDGDPESFLRRLWQHAQQPLQRVLAACDTPLPTTAEAFITLLARHDQGQGTAHTALPGTHVAMIRNSASLHRTASQVLHEIEDAELDAEQRCQILQADERVQKALFAMPSPWPGERLRQWRQPIAIALSVVLTFVLLGSTALQSLLTLDFQLPLSLLLTLALLLVPILAGSGEKDSALRWLYPLGALTLAGLLLSLLWRENLILLPLLFYGGLLLFTLFSIFVLNRIPGTAGSEQYLKHGFSLAFLLGVLLVTFSELSSGIPALAAQQGWLLFVLGFLSLIAFVPVLPLPIVEPRAMLLATLLYLFNPLPLPQVFHVTALILTLLILALVCTLGYMNCLLQAQEQQDEESIPDWPPGPSRSQITLFESTRSNSHNHLISVTTVKPGFLRAFAIRLVLRIVGTTAALAGTRGELSGIETIHFARWILVGHKRDQLLFISNYCGRWDSYLDEFIDQASGGLTSIWSNTRGFPRSQWLSGGGATAEQRFKLFARRSQVPTLYHFSAYPELTVNQIEKNLRLNALLRARSLNREECEEVLRLL